ncbi:hypothetical protein NPIL_284571 [Nephila pilipes]|uniref:Uncharacterized protein n=1 Tax=Nephila pilipes TaxID=299642 RepID=A0A8X6MWS5_NEPPI|nr:hypothetical protein NPIL_284571 [Nephila pilipes]
MASRLFQHIGKELVKPFGRQIVAPQCAGFHPRKPKSERKSKRVLKFIAFIVCYSITTNIMENRYDGPAEYTLEWTIENFSYAWQKYGDKLVSPVFVITMNCILELRKKRNA